MAGLFLSADAFTDNTLAVEAGYSLGPGPVYGSPSLVSSPAANGGQQASNVPASNTFGTFPVGANLYALFSTQHVSFATRMYKSTDDGTTWVEMDAANAPPWTNATGYFDSVTNAVIVAARTNNAAAGALVLQNFDLTTDTWGAVYAAAGAPTVAIVQTVWKRSDNTLLVLYESRRTFPGDGSSGLGAVAYDIAGGTWGAAFDAGLALLSLAGWDASQTVVDTHAMSSYMDAAGNVGVFFPTTSLQTVPVIWGNRCFYQQILLNNALGAFEDFPGQVQPLQLYNGVIPSQALVAFSGSPMGRPVLLPTQDIIVLPVLATNFNVADRFPKQLACVLTGSPISNPTWAALDITKSIDPDVFVDDSIYPESWGSTVFDGTTISVVFSAQGPDFSTDFQRIRLCQTVNLGSPVDGWAGSQAFSLLDDPGFDFVGQALLAPALSVPSGSPLVVTCASPPLGVVGKPYSHTFPATGGVGLHFFAVAGAGLPPGVGIDPATGIASGVPSTAGHFAFTVVVTDSVATTASVDCSITIEPNTSFAVGGGGGFQGIRPSFCGCSPQVLAAEKLRRLSVRKRVFPYSFIFPARVSIPLELLASAAVAGVGVTVAVISYTVPEGLRLILQGVLQDYAGGAAFLPGDALWTLDMNNGASNVQAMAVQGLTNVPIPLGSIAAGSVWPFPRAYAFSPLTLIRATATNVNLSGGFFHSGLFGYLVPDVPK